MIEEMNSATQFQADVTRMPNWIKLPVKQAEAIRELVWGVSQCTRRYLAVQTDL
jgi:hypothetical protein